VIPTRRLLAGAAAAVACVMVASGCDTSPVAVSVNSQQIQQTAVNAELRAYSGNERYVTVFNSDQGNQAAGLSIQGRAPGTYNSHFVANVLDDQIVSAALSQYLKARHDLPGPELLAAMRGWDAQRYGPTWLGFPAWFRSELARRDAVQAQFVTVSKNTASLRKLVKSASGYLYSQVCVRQVAFAARNSAGGVDYPAALEAAHRALSGGKLTGGAVTCYSEPQLESLGESFFHTVSSLGVGRATPAERTSFGYQVYAVTRRAALPFDAALKRATTLVDNESHGQAPNPIEQRIVAAARIHLNPQYGTWDPKTGVTPPVVKSTAS
jgi:hypothetical protein